jgi:hypothetical protein
MQEEKRAYVWGKRPRIERAYDEGPVRDSQMPHGQANVDALLRREILVCERIKKYIGTRSE